MNCAFDAHVRKLYTSGTLHRVSAHMSHFPRNWQIKWYYET